MKRTVHFLYRVRFGELLLGPDLRLWNLASKAAEAGHKVVVHVLAGSRNPFPPEIHFQELAPGFTRSIGPTDAIVASELLPARATWELLRSRKPFHWDCYGLSLPETLSFTHQWPALRSLGDRRRKLLRYRILGHAAERTWVSHEGQSTFLAALQAVSRHRALAWDAFQAPARTLCIPMGLPDTPAPSGSSNPYPEVLRGRPVLLWGGGIWNWFDVPTVIRAMLELRESGSPHALFFLSGRNEATKDYDKPLRDALRAAGDADLLGTSVLFNDQRVTPDQLGPWLEHCSTGIMGNLPTLESRLSWRTRYLDLLWAGRPLVASGSDPLARNMERSGAARLAPEGDPAALAKAIRHLATADSRWIEACARSKALGETMRWSEVVKPFLEALEDPDAFRAPAAGIGATQALRYALGI